MGGLLGNGDPYKIKAYMIYLSQSGKTVFSWSVKFDKEFMLSSQVQRLDTSSDIFQTMVAIRRLQMKTLKQPHIDSSMAKELHSI